MFVTTNTSTVTHSLARYGCFPLYIIHTVPYLQLEDLQCAFAIFVFVFVCGFCAFAICALCSTCIHGFVCLWFVFVVCAFYVAFVFVIRTILVIFVICYTCGICDLLYLWFCYICDLLFVLLVILILLVQTKWTVQCNCWFVLVVWHVTRTCVCKSRYVFRKCAFAQMLICIRCVTHDNDLHFQLPTCVSQMRISNFISTCRIWLNTNCTCDFFIFTYVQINIIKDYIFHT